MKEKTPTLSARIHGVTLRRTKRCSAPNRCRTIKRTRLPRGVAIGATSACCKKLTNEKVPTRQTICGLFYMRSSRLVPTRGYKRAVEGGPPEVVIDSFG